MPSTLTRRLPKFSLPTFHWRTFGARPQPVPAEPPAAATPLRPRIDIAVRAVSPEGEARSRHRNLGRHLARQGAWDDLGAAIREADAARAATPGGLPVAALMADGAASDALDSARLAVRDDDPGQARLAMTDLQDNLADCPDDFGAAAVVARAHVALAEAWDVQARRGKHAAACNDARDRCYETALCLADRFDPFALDSPLLARLRCALLAIDARPQARVADDYEDAIDLDPACPDHMRALGRDLMPDRYGDFEKLDREARRTAARVQDIWGLGGYVWVMLDPLTLDPRAFRRLDAELFIAGMHDILERRGDQHMVNRLAAFCGYSLSGKAIAGSTRARIANCLGWIARDHLREVHPLAWTEARRPGQTEDRPGEDPVSRGKVRALSALAEHFAPQLRDDQRLIFSDAGLNFLRDA
ncbi:hypothetical protein KUH32_16100 [Thalassococcus sp. CAU 1522]|uniref:Uncharacterized protein n=1 Tax=Thalassococcus arenae TaxID=2851652 RepID=A0ABS6NBX8_9RHOB|nr:hypothetical protein [Thalassococcus arenae]MBV2361288.1 hypothetical protein [Thalassococcus arenae]